MRDASRERESARRSARSLAPLVLACGAASACATVSPLATPRFADVPVVWEDDDRRPFAPPPTAFYSPYFWDAMDHSFFRPVAEVWRLEPGRRALDVNALDEVPDSSWFENRLSRFDLDPAELARGACRESTDPIPKPWRVVGGKPDGLNPGFMIEDAAGRRHLLKTDGELQPERATGADVVGAILHHAAGYHVPCNRIVRFRPEDLTLDPGALVRRTRGTVRAMTADDVAKVLRASSRDDDGSLRASVSELLGGLVIGPWRYSGVDADDPNDVIDHRDRRELRGLRVLSAWIERIDARQENTLRTFVDRDGDGRGHVRHWLLDFGDAFGLLSTIPSLSPRFGHAGYFDTVQVLVDLATLGLLDRPWRDATASAVGPALGYYGAARFDPDRWRPGYPNPAFDARDEADSAWMARILARFTEAHVGAALGAGEFSPAVHDELARVLLLRRAELLERHLTRLSPLTEPRLVRVEDTRFVCVEDRAVTGGLRAFGDRRYGGRLWLDRRAPVDLAAREMRVARPGEVCLPLGEAARLTEGLTNPYAVVELFVATPGLDTPAPLEVHLRLDEPPRVVGLVRREAR